MRIINTRLHGALDYLVSLLLIGAPWIFDFANGGSETWVPVLLGAASIVYSLFTDYEFGAVKALSMRTHLALDIASGSALAMSPWILGFSDQVYVPHLLFGVLEIGSALMTNPLTYKQHSSRISGERGY